MEFPKSTYVITMDIWFTDGAGVKKPSRGVGYAYAESVVQALETIKGDIALRARAYDWEDVQVLSVMPTADRDLIEYAQRAAIAQRSGRWSGI